MIAPTRCLNCGAGGNWSRTTDDARSYRFDFVWAASYEMDHAQCYSCGTDHRLVKTDYAPSQTHSWTANVTYLLDGEDYDVIARRGGERKFDGSNKLVVAWCYHPLSNGHWIDKAITSHVRSDPVFAVPGVTRLAVLPWFASDALKQIADNMDEVWVLRKHVTLDAAGPFPSLRAEISIFDTLVEYKLSQVQCYWPSVFFSLRQHVPMMNREQMQTEWSNYARSHIQLEKPRRVK